MLLALLFLASSSSAAEVPDFVATADARALALYTPLLHPGESFRIEHISGKDQSVVGSATRSPAEEFRVIFDSGFVKSPRLTPDGYRFGLCHEIGHLFGGLPHRAAPEGWEGPLDDSGRMLLSSEGQADYYASRICFRRLVEGEDHARALGERVVPPSLKQECDEAWGRDSIDSLVCQRAALGGFDMLRLVFDFKISFEARDPDVVEKTLDIYPSRQCRLDTARAGALCLTAAPLDLAGKELSSFGCAAGKVARPACWFKP